MPLNSESETPILCWYRLCRNKDCRKPMLLPLGMLQQPFQGQADPPKGYHALALVCRYCKHVEMYSLKPDSPYKDHSDKRVWNIPSEDGEVVEQLRCVEAGCKSLLPLVEVWSSGTKRGNDRNVWVWGELVCQNGHRVERVKEG